MRGTGESRHGRLPEPQLRRDPGRLRRKARHRRRGFSDRLHRPSLSARRRPAGHASGRKHREAPRGGAALRRARGELHTAYMNEREMPYWKITAVRDTFREDHPSSALDPRIHDPSYDLTVCKKAPSIFFETGVSAYFVKERVDTVIVTGCNTSGCIRATAIDSFSYRFRTIVPEDCVGDIEE